MFHLSGGRNIVWLVGIHELQSDSTRPLYVGRLNDLSVWQDGPESQSDSTMRVFFLTPASSANSWSITMALGKSLSKAVAKAVEGTTWKKFSNPSASRGKTVHPKSTKEQEALGIRWDYDGEVTKADGVYHKYQLQANAGKVPSSIKQWRDTNGGTHAVMATSFVKKDGTKDDVEKGLREAAESVGS
nr:hypothetical protein CFP56_56560 [Quercus suber]